MEESKENQSLPRKLCTSCGAELSGSAEGSVCPKCLLGTAMADSTSIDVADSGLSISVRSTGATGSRSGAGGWEPPAVEELQALLPQYEIESIIGRGGMGAVYRGRQAALDRPVAIKLLPETLAEQDDGRNFVERFKLEARAMAGLDHPAIISVHDFGQTAAGHLYFVMEFVDGMDMHKYIQLSGGKVEAETAVAIVSHVLDALDYAHRKGIVHRDIKPANVLINREGRVKIADFGLAKKLAGDDDPATTGLTMSNVALGTPDFIAPEALDPNAVPDQRADLYAVGVMLYQMLTGKLPRGIFKLPSELDEGIDTRLDDILTLAMESDPGGRFQSATEFRLKLDELASAPVEKIVPEVPSAAVEAPAEQFDFTEPGLRKSESLRRHPPRRPVPARKRPSMVGPVVWTTIVSLVVGGGLFWWIVGPGDDPDSSSLGVVSDPARLIESGAGAPVTAVVDSVPVTGGTPAGAPDALNMRSADETSSADRNTLAPDPAPDPVSQKGSLPREQENDPAPIAATSFPAADSGAETLQNVPGFKARIAGFQGARKAQLGDLVGKYREALARSEEASISAGDLTGVEAVRAAIRNADEYSAAVAGLSDTESVESLPVPPPLGESAPEDLKRLRGILDQEAGKIEGVLRSQLARSMEALQTELVKQSRIAEARELEAWRSGNLGTVVVASVAAAENEDGEGGDWIELFDGSYLDGWTVRGGSGKFVVEDGQIMGEIEAGSPSTFLCTEREFADFELEFEVRLGGPTNSGVQFRSALKDVGSNPFGGIVHGPQIEIMESPGSSGYVYGEATGKGWISPVQAEVSKFENDKFNHFRVVAEGPRIRTWINGERVEDVIDYSVYAGYRSGFVGLQVHRLKQGEKPFPVFWKNIRIRPIGPVGASGASVKTAAAVWTDSFDDTDLKGWRTLGDPNAFRLDGGALRAGKPSRPSLLVWTGDAAAPKKVKNFEMTFRTRSDGTAANSGIYFHIDEGLQLTGRSWPDQGQEIQLAMETAKGTQATGGLYGLVAPDFELPDSGNWRDVRIRVEGTRVQCWIDGREALDYTEPIDLPPASPYQHLRISPVGGAIAIQANSRNGAFLFDDFEIRTWQ